MATTNRLSPIPQPPTKPVVGNMLLLDSTAPVQNLARLARELGPIFWLDMMGAPIVIVSGHDLVEELSDEKRFDKAVRGPLRRVRAVAGDGLFTADTTEPNWSKAHNILLQPFGNRAMQSYHPSMVDIADQLVKKWQRLNGDEEIDVVHDMTALTLDTIGLCGFDYRFNSFYRRDYHPFVESLVRSLETIMMIRGLPLESLWMQKRRRNLARDVAFMNKMVDEIVAERRKNAAAAEDKKDMLGAMMTGVDRATGEQLDDVNIRYQINTFLIAGHETTSGLLSCTLYALLKHPDVLKKAYAEVDRVLGPDLDARPTYQQVTQLTYITQILKEALRLWPPAPAYGISPLQDETIGGKYRLKKNTFITVLVLALHRDPSVWGPNPDAFDPENFSREAEAARPINAWKPFGNGQRACIGRGFAMHEAALAIGMILQRFKLIDVNRYQMVLKETLTIKPDGFKIKVRPRTEKDRGAHGGSAAVAAASTAAAAPRARARPGHNTPLLVLYGSNLGTAEELATRVADLAEVNGFATRLAPLDDFAGKLPEQGGVLIFCASYNGAPPDNATQFVKWLGSDLPNDAFARRALRGVRLRQQRLGRDLPVDSAPDRRAVGGAWRPQRVCARRRRCAQRSRRPVRDLVRQAGAGRDPANSASIRLSAAAPTTNRYTASSRSRPRSQCDGSARRRRADEGAGQQRIAKQGWPVSLRPLDPAHRGGAAGRHRLPGRRSSQRGAAQRSGAGRRGGAPLRLSARRPDPPAGRRRPPRAIAGRRRGIGRAAADRLRRAAAGRDPQADPDHVGTHALSGDQAETGGLCRRRCRRNRTLSRRYPRQAQIGVRPAGGISGLRIAVACLSRNAVAAGAALLFDLVVAGERCFALQRHRRRGRGPGEFGARRLQGHLLELPRRPPCRRDHPGHRARDQGRLPPARRRFRADHHGRTGHRSGAVPRLPAAARGAEGRAAPASARRCCFSAAGIPIRIFSTPTN